MGNNSYLFLPTQLSPRA